jgi:3-hydroxyacyl-[acyl-carrier-protein] dehydratase
MNSMRQAISRSALGPASLAADSGEQSFCFAADFLGFAGHFPGYPILPAILQALMAQMVAEQVHGERLEFLSLERAKFKRELRPAEQIRVKIAFREASEPLCCKVELSCGAESAATFSLNFAAGARR